MLQEGKPIVMKNVKDDGEVKNNFELYTCG